MKLFGATLVFGCIGALLVACSSSNGGSSGGGSTGGQGTGQGGVVGAPPATVTCAEVCTNVTKCGVAAATCQSVCPKLSLACQGCLAKATCQDACVAATCGNVTSNPKKAPQPVAGAHCDPLTFDFADHPANNPAGTAGAACVVPWDCFSQACISGTIGTEQTSFCASEVDCRNTDPQLSDPCPTGWKCTQVPAASSDATRWTCVPPNANVCSNSQLTR